MERQNSTDQNAKMWSHLTKEKGGKCSDSMCLGGRENAPLKATAVPVTAYVRACYLPIDPLRPASH